MDNLSPAQQAIVQELITNGSIPIKDVHTLTAKALKGEGLIEVEGTNFVLSEAGCAEFCEPQPENVVDVSFGFNEEEPQPVKVDLDGDGEDVVSAEGVTILQTVTLKDDMSIQVDKHGKLVRIPAGTIIPVLSYHEERTRKGIIKWFSVIFPPTMTIFQVSSLRNKSTPIEPTPLTDFM